MTAYHFSFYINSKTVGNTTDFGDFIFGFSFIELFSECRMNKIIICPFCRTKNVVGHMDWTAIKCIKSKCSRTIHQDIENIMDEVFSTVHRNINKIEDVMKELE